MAETPRRLERDPNNKMIAGVASGVAEYFGIDPTIVRVLWAITVLFGGLGVVVYIVMWIVVPEADPTPAALDEEAETPEPSTADDVAEPPTTSQPDPPATEPPGDAADG
jgi:phage shock protein C